jgi:hypothetical protein
MGWILLNNVFCCMMAITHPDIATLVDPLFGKP